MVDKEISVSYTSHNSMSDRTMIRLLEMPYRSFKIDINFALKQDSYLSWNILQDHI